MHFPEYTDLLETFAFFFGQASSKNLFCTFFSTAELIELSQNITYIRVQPEIVKFPLKSVLVNLL